MGPSGRSWTKRDAPDGTHRAKVGRPLCAVPGLTRDLGRRSREVPGLRPGQHSHGGSVSANGHQDHVHRAVNHRPNRSTAACNTTVKTASTISAANIRSIFERELA